MSKQKASLPENIGKKFLNWRFALFITNSYTIVKQTELP